MSISKRLDWSHSVGKAIISTVKILEKHQCYFDPQNAFGFAMCYYNIPVMEYLHTNYAITETLQCNYTQFCNDRISSMLDVYKWLVEHHFTFPNNEGITNHIIGILCGTIKIGSPNPNSQFNEFNNLINFFIDNNIPIYVNHLNYDKIPHLLNDETFDRVLDYLITPEGYCI